MQYHIVFYGGLGDILSQCYQFGFYNGLLAMTRDDRCTVDVISQNPFVHELFTHHPRRQQLDLHFWEANDEAARFVETRGFFPCPKSPPVPLPKQDGPPIWYSYLEERERIDLAKGRIVFAVSAGEKWRNIPQEIVHKIHDVLLDKGLMPVWTGRRYLMAGKHEMSALAGGLDLIDQLTVPGVCELVRRSAGIVSCHSALSLVAWHERVPMLLLYPERTREVCFDTDHHFGFGKDFPETVHGTFEEFEAIMIKRFIRAILSSCRCPSGCSAEEDGVKTASDPRTPL